MHILTKGHAQACCHHVDVMMKSCCIQYHKQVTVATGYRVRVPLTSNGCHSNVCDEYHRQATVATRGVGPEYHKQVTVATQGCVRVPLTSNGCHSYGGHEYHRQATVATHEGNMWAEYHKQVTVATQRGGGHEYHEQVTVATHVGVGCFEYHQQVTVATQSGQRVPLSSNGCHSLCCHLVSPLNRRKAALVAFWGNGKIYVWGNEMSVLLTNLKGSYFGMLKPFGRKEDRR